MGKEFPTRSFIEDMRDCFGMGAIVFPAGYVLKGVPKGKAGLEAGLRAARLYGPEYTAIGMSIGGIYFTTYYAMKYVRQKEDIWNHVVAGIPTAGHISHQHGLRIATRSAFLYGPIGGLLFGYIYSMD